MKKADVMLTFLFFAILALVIFVPTVLWASQFFKLSDRALNSYNKLLELVSQVKDGEISSMPLYMDDNSAIIGISKNGKRFESKSGRGDASSVTYFEKNDPKCQDKTCVCLCKEIDYEKINVMERKITCKETRCNPFDNVEFLKIRPLTDFSTPQPYPGLAKFDYWWENGFIIITQTKVDKTLGDKTLLATIGFGGLQNEMKKKLKIIYIQKYKNYVNVCYNQTCITDEIKNEINKNDITTYNYLQKVK